MCPQCRAFISSDDKTCPYCNEAIGPSAGAIGPQDALASMIPDHATITLLFLLLNAGFWIASVMISSNQGNGNALMGLDTRTLILLGAKWRPEIVFSGQWWRLLTAGFLHGGLVHLFMNGMSLYQIGRHCEDFLGPARLFLIYIFSTVAGFGLSLLISPGSLSVGASAAIAGLVGAMYASSRFPGSPTAQGKKLYGYWTLGLLLFGFLGNLSEQMRIDNAAHIGGWLGGYLLVTLAGFPGPNRSTRETVLKVLMGVAVLIALLSFWKMYLFFAAVSPTPAYQRM
jgi:rhomboid protease GluP